MATKKEHPIVTCQYCKRKYRERNRTYTNCGDANCQRLHRNVLAKRQRVKVKKQRGWVEGKPKTMVCTVCHRKFDVPGNAKSRRKYCGPKCARIRERERQTELRTHHKAKITLPESDKKPDLSKGKTLDYWRRMIIFSCHLERKRGRAFIVPVKWQTAIDQLKGE